MHKKCGALLLALLVLSAGLCWGQSEKNPSKTQDYKSLIASLKQAIAAQEASDNLLRSLQAENLQLQTELTALKQDLQTSGTALQESLKMAESLKMSLSSASESLKTYKSNQQTLETWNMVLGIGSGLFATAFVVSLIVK